MTSEELYWRTITNLKGNPLKPHVVKREDKWVWGFGPHGVRIAPPCDRYERWEDAIESALTHLRATIEYAIRESQIIPLDNPSQSC